MNNDIVKYGALAGVIWWAWSKYGSSTNTSSAGALSIQSISPTSLVAGQGATLQVTLMGAVAPTFKWNGADVTGSGTATDPTKAATFTVAVPSTVAGTGSLLITDSGRTALATMAVAAAQPSGNNPPPPTPPPPTPPPPTPPPPSPMILDATFASPDFGTAAYVSRVAAMLNKAANPSIGGGLFANTGHNFDEWAYVYQSNGGSAITPELMGWIIDSGGGDRAKVVSASDWVSYLVAAQKKGLSGWGFGS